jgi:hypothetical protein
MEKNKTGKYFKYAIGEIVLVMIGILLALQVNNWNNEKQIQTANKIYLTRLLIDLSTTEDRLKTVLYEGFDSEYARYPSLIDAVNACDSMLRLTYKGLDKTHFDYLINTEINSGNSLLNIVDNTYSEMLNTGKIYTLKSDTLTEAITRYYKIGEREAIYNTANTNQFRKGLDRITDGYQKMKMDYLYNPDGFQLDDYNFYLDHNSKDYKDFQIGLSMMLEGQRNNMTKMKLIIEETELLKSIITKALKNYD